MVPPWILGRRIHFWVSDKYTSLVYTCIWLSICCPSRQHQAVQLKVCIVKDNWDCTFFLPANTAVPRIGLVYFPFNVTNIHCAPNVWCDWWNRNCKLLAHGLYLTQGPLLFSLRRVCFALIFNKLPKFKNQDILPKNVDFKLFLKIHLAIVGLHFHMAKPTRNTSDRQALPV